MWRDLSQYVEREKEGKGDGVPTFPVVRTRSEAEGLPGTAGPRHPMCLGVRASGRSQRRTRQVRVMRAALYLAGFASEMGFQLGHVVMRHASSSCYVTLRGPRSKTCIRVSDHQVDGEPRKGWLTDWVIGRGRGERDRVRRMLAVKSVFG